MSLRPAPRAVKSLFFRGDTLHERLRERQADGAVGVVEAALGEREAAAAGAVLGVERLQRLGATVGGQLRQIDAGDLVRLRGVGEPDLVFILGVDDRDVGRETGERPRLEIRQRRVQQADVLLGDASIAIVGFAKKPVSDSRTNDVGSA